MTRRVAGAVMAATAVVAFAAGCSKANQGTATPTTTDKAAATAALWDPCSKVTDSVLQQMGVDPATKQTGIGGVPQDGWKICSWHDTPDYKFTVGVWSSSFTIQDLKNKKDNTDFTDVVVGGRNGMRHKSASDTQGEDCYISFPSRQGMFEVSVYNQDSDETTSACDRVQTVAADVVSILPN